MNYVEFAAIVLGLESKKDSKREKPRLCKKKKDDVFSICNMTLMMVFVTNIQQLYVPSVM